MLSDAPVRTLTDDEYALVVQRFRRESILAGLGAAFFGVLTLGFAYGLETVVVVVTLLGVAVCLLATGLIAVLSRKALRTAAGLPKDGPVHRIQGRFRLGPRPPRTIGGRAVFPLGGWPAGLSPGDVVEGEVFIASPNTGALLLSVRHADGPVSEADASGVQAPSETP